MEAAKKLGISDRTLRREVERGNIKAVYVHDSLKDISEEELDRYLKTQTPKYAQIPASTETPLDVAACIKHIRSLEVDIFELQKSVKELEEIVSTLLADRSKKPAIARLKEIELQERNEIKEMQQEKEQEYKLPFDSNALWDSIQNVYFVGIREKWELFLSENDPKFVKKQYNFKFLNYELRDISRFPEEQTTREIFKTISEADLIFVYVESEMEVSLFNQHVAIITYAKALKKNIYFSNITSQHYLKHLFEGEQNTKIDYESDIKKGFTNALTYFNKQTKFIKYNNGSFYTEQILWEHMQERLTGKRNGKYSPVDMFGSFKALDPYYRLIAQYPIKNHRVDFVHLDSKTIMEIEGWEYHGKDKQNFYNDFIRYREIEDLEYDIFRVSAKEVQENVSKVFDELIQRINRNRKKKKESKIFSTLLQKIMELRNERNEFSFLNKALRLVKMEEKDFLEEETHFYSEEDEEDENDRLFEEANQLLEEEDLQNYFEEDNENDDLSELTEDIITTETL
jgi:excisionase family DNA binding protein